MSFFSQLLIRFSLNDGDELFNGIVGILLGRRWIPWADVTLLHQMGPPREICPLMRAF